MNTSFQLTEGKDEWLTPPEIIEAIADFDLDPCSPVKRPWDTAKKHYTIEDDGLKQPWDGYVWCNPPYGTETKRWVAKMADHNNGVMLIFARTGTRLFHDVILKRASCLFFFKGRLSFYHVDGTKGGTAGADSMLVGFGDKAFSDIERAWENGGINGKVFKL